MTSVDNIQSTILESTRMARDYALQGNYQTSLLGFQGAIEQIQIYISALQDSGLKQKWSKALEDLQTEYELVRSIQTELCSFQDIQVVNTFDLVKSTSTSSSSNASRKTVDQRSPSVVDRSKRPSVSTAFTVGANPSKPVSKPPTRLQSQQATRKDSSNASTTANQATKK